MQQRGRKPGGSRQGGSSGRQNKGKRHGDYSKYFPKEKIVDPEKNKQIKKIQKRERQEVIDQLEHQKSLFDKDGLARLNKYIAHAGVCSRREADKIIESGAIKVNGEVVTELGYKIGRNDRVVMGGELLKAERFQYVLLNKPKDFVTTTKDPKHEKVVMNLVEKACSERIYPVGRLDRNTTGVLLFTNDGDLAKYLTHPKHRIAKIYRVTLNKDFTKADFDKVVEGFELEDGFIKADKLSYVEDKDSKRELGIEIHSGRNRIVRRVFEHLGYDVIKLDRVLFAGLTKKDLPRGRWRHLSKEEVSFLKMVR